MFHTSISIFLHFLRFLGKISKYVYDNLSDESLVSERGGGGRTS